MDSRTVNLFVYDSKDNYAKTKSHLGFEGSTIKSITPVEDVFQLRGYIEDQLEHDDLILLVVHVFAYEKIKGIKNFITSGILDKYKDLPFMYITDSGDQKEIQKLMIHLELEPKHIYLYHEVVEELRNDRIKPITKKELLASSEGDGNNRNSTEKLGSKKYKPEDCEYVIMTALEEDEMSPILPFIQNIGNVPNDKHLIEYGHLINKPGKRIVYASMQSTGMVDAAILATELLVRYNPKYLIMPGVLGGKPNDVNFGDIIISTKVFTIDKGKITEVEEILNDEAVNRELEYIEKETKIVFKPEIESVSINSSAISKFIRNKRSILNYINEVVPESTQEIDLLYGPVACVRQVIDQKVYFEGQILTIERKAIGLEMESYGIARACELINNGATVPIIVKSVMDHTSGKTDEKKEIAAKSSAMFVKYILENDLI